MHAQWLPSCSGAQEDPSAQYQGPIRTALRNTWRPIRTVTFVAPLTFLRRFHRRERAGVHAHNTTPRWHVKLLIHNLTHLFNADGQIVCLKLMPKVPIQCRKRLFLDDYPIHRALGANPEQWKTFAMRCYTPIDLNMSMLCEQYKFTIICFYREKVVSYYRQLSTVRWENDGSPLWPIRTWRHRVTQAEYRLPPVSMFWILLKRF